MSFLAIDGITIPVQSSQVEIANAGGITQTALGTSINSKFSLKKRIKIDTAPMPRDKVEAFLAMMSGRAKLWSFAGEAYSTDGYAPVSDTESTYYDGLADADTKTYAQRETDDVPFGAYLGQYSFCAGHTTENLLSAESASFTTGAGDWSAVDGSVSRVALGVDTGSLEVTADGAGDGSAKVSESGSFSTDEDYVASAYVRAFDADVSSATITVALYASSVLQRSSSETFDIVSTRWTRLFAHLDTSTDTGDEIRVTVSFSAGAADKIYVDKAQLEAGIVPTAWLAGGSTRSAGSTQLVDSTRSPFGGWTRAWSCNLWCRALDGYDGDETLFDFQSGDIKLENKTSSVKLTTSVDSLEASTTAADLGSWTMVTVNMWLDDDNETHVEIWRNGALLDSDTYEAGSEPYMLGEMTTGSILNKLPISQLLFLPTRLSSDVISDLYNSGSGVVIGSWPNHRVTGDILGSDAVMTALVSVDAVTMRPMMHGASWTNNMCVLSLTLLEV